MTVAEVCNGLRKVLVPATPVMDDLWTLDAEPSGDVGGVHQIVEINFAPHNTTVPGGCDTCLATNCV